MTAESNPTAAISKDDNDDETAAKEEEEGVPHVVTTTTTMSTTTHASASSPSYLTPVGHCDILFGRTLQVFVEEYKSFLVIGFVACGLRALLAFVFDVVNGPQYGADYYGATSRSTGSSTSSSIIPLSFLYGKHLDANDSSSNVVDDEMHVDVQDIVATLFMKWVDSLILFVVACLANGACIHLVAIMYAKHQPKQQQHQHEEQGSLSLAVTAIGIAAHHGVALIGSCLVVMVGLFVVLFTLMMLAMIPIIISGGENSVRVHLLFVALTTAATVIYVSLVTYFIYPAIIVEQKGIWDSINRSLHLTQGYLCKLLGICVFYSFFEMFLRLFVTVVTSSDTQVAMIARIVLRLCLDTFLFSISAM